MTGQRKQRTHYWLRCVEFGSSFAQSFAQSILPFQRWMDVRTGCWLQWLTIQSNFSHVSVSVWSDVSRPVTVIRTVLSFHHFWITRGCPFMPLALFSFQSNFWVFIFTNKIFYYPRSLESKRYRDLKKQYKNSNSIFSFLNNLLSQKEKETLVNNIRRYNVIKVNILRKFIFSNKW